MTTQAASGGRLTLGVGTSHRFLVEGVWGMSFAAPARRMQSYLAALQSAMAGDQVDIEDEWVTARLPRPLEFDGQHRPPVLVAALGDRMLDTAGAHADGTVTWLAGIKTLSTRIIPRIDAAAHRSGRQRPAVVAALPVCVTEDTAAMRSTADRLLARYASVPSYRRLLDLEGVDTPTGVALIGDEEQVSDGVAALAEVGVTELCAWTFGSAADQRRTIDVLLQQR
jgi:5,10-methylenetetrahydromethanopterin reductase